MVSADGVRYYCDGEFLDVYGRFSHAQKTPEQNAARCRNAQVGAANVSTFQHITSKNSVMLLSTRKQLWSNGAVGYRCRPVRLLQPSPRDIYGTPAVIPFLSMK